MTNSVCTVVALLLTYAAVTFSSPLGSPEDIAQENLKKLALANNELSINLHRQLTAESSGNVFYSPLSLSTAFGMLYYGTKGDTAKELRAALGYDAAKLEEELVHQTFQQYLTERLPSQDSSSYVLNAANAVFLDKRLNLVPSYKKEVQDLYQASVQDVDFATETPQVVRKINSWVSEKTNGKIYKLVDDLDPSSALVLLNAVYFKGTWKTQFETSKTKPETFYNNGLETGANKVPMMKMRNELPFYQVREFKALELPYKGENISMIILLPRQRDGLESMEKTLTLEKLSVIRKQLRISEVDVTIPKFKIEYSRYMSQDFKSIGAKRVFTPEADLSGIASNPNVFVSQVVHKAVVEVNEEGSEAAAATGIFVLLSATPSFRADHPFLFAIVDNRNDMILFSGRVTNL